MYLVLEDTFIWHSLWLPCFQTVTTVNAKFELLNINEENQENGNIDHKILDLAVLENMVLPQHNTKVLRFLEFAVDIWKQQYDVTDATFALYTVNDKAKHHNTIRS